MYNGNKTRHAHRAQGSGSGGTGGSQGQPPCAPHHSPAPCTLPALTHMDGAARASVLSRPAWPWPGPACGQGLSATRVCVWPGTPHRAGHLPEPGPALCWLQQPACAACRGCRVAVASSYSAMHTACWQLTTTGLSVPRHRYASTRTLTYNRLYIHVCTHTHTHMHMYMYMYHTPAGRISDIL